MYLIYHAVLESLRKNFNFFEVCSYSKKCQIQRFCFPAVHDICYHMLPLFITNSANFSEGKLVVTWYRSSGTISSSSWRQQLLTTAASSLSSSPHVVVQARNDAAVVLTAVAAREKICYYYTAAANVSGIAYERHGTVAAAARASVNSWRGAGAITKAGAATGTSCARGSVCGLAAADTAVARRADERESRVTYGNSRTRRRKGED